MTNELWWFSTTHSHTHVRTYYLQIALKLPILDSLKMNGSNPVIRHDNLKMMVKSFLKINNNFVKTTS